MFYLQVNVRSVGSVGTVGAPMSPGADLHGLIPPNPNATQQSAALKESNQQLREALKRHVSIQFSL